MQDDPDALEVNVGEHALSNYLYRHCVIGAAQMNHDRRLDAPYSALLSTESQALVSKRSLLPIFLYSIYGVLP